LSYEIDCPPEHAFEVWTTRLSAWWPKGHLASGDPDTLVILEPRLGGRIFERTPDGTEIDWGEITLWGPPSRLVHAGWDRLGAEGPAWRSANTNGWDALLPRYIAAAETR
jgi:hypothetical protein